MNYLVTLATHGEDRFQDRTVMLTDLISQCRDSLNVDRFIWDMPRLKSSILYNVYKSWFTPECYLGYWAWKPWILLDALTKVEDGDIVALLDSDLHASQLPDFLALAKEHKACFIGHNFRNDRFCTGDAFYLMGMNEEKYWGANHVWGAVNFLTRCPETMAFATDWLACNLNLELLTSQNKYEPNHPGFEGTRWNQGPYTNLIVKYGFKILDNGRAFAFSHPARPMPFT